MAYDACIIGAGPAGCIAANKGCKENDIVLIGKRASKVQCAGLISKSGLSRLGLVDDAYVLNEVRGARFYSPDNTIFEVDAQKTVAHVVDRIGFDHHLLDMAVDAGVEYREDRVVDFSRTIELGCGDKVDAERIVLATGSDYSMHSQFGFKRPGEILVGMQYEMKLEADSDFVELYFNVPDFFSWVIPLGDTARIGLCTKGNPRPFMESFLKRLKKYNGKPFPKEIDDEFSEIAMERLNEYKFRTLVINPVKRSVALWSNLFSSYAWPNELPSKVSHEKRLQTKRDGGLIDLALQYPFIALTKAITGGYKILLQFLFILIILLVMSRMIKNKRIKNVLWIVGGMVFTRTIFFALTNNVETRYTVEAVPGMELIVVFGVLNYYITHKKRIQIG